MQGHDPRPERGEGRDRVMDLRKGVEAVIEERRKDKPMPTHDEIRQREHAVLHMLERVPQVKTVDVARELGLGNDAAGHLLRRLAVEGKVQRHGNGPGVMWSRPGQEAQAPPPGQSPRRPKVATLQPRDISPAANGRGEPERVDLQGRYVALLLDRRPDRLMALIETGRIDLTDEVLDAIEQVVFAKAS
jgi:hypothetical protein